MNTAPSMQEALREIRRRATEAREFALESIARALEWSADQVEAALRTEADRVLTLKQASDISGYDRDHLARLIREGKLPNAGRKGAPRIRASDVPRKPTRSGASMGKRSYDPVADARNILSRR